MAAENILLLATGILDSAFDSQVLDPCSFLIKNDVPASIVSYEPSAHWSKQNRLEKLGGIPVPIISLRCLPFVGRLSCWFDGLRLRPLLTSSTVVHARGAINAYRYLRAGGDGERLLTDFRGVLGDEMTRYANGISRLVERFRTREVDQMTKLVVQRSGRILAVSEVLKRHLVEVYGADPEKITVVPCVVEEEKFAYSVENRHKLRTAMGVDDRLVFLYCGGIEKWQGVEQTIALFKKIKEIHPSSFLLFLTRAKPQATLMLQSQMDAQDFKILSVPHEDIASYFHAADIGLLLREINPTNAVASPIKFSEYLVSGLPVIVNRGVGDTGLLVELLKAGEVIPEPNSFPEHLEWIPRSDAQRKALSSNAAKQLSIKANYGGRIRKLYGFMDNS
tara:strand:- start:260 stop:1435 length:1176 start_codon:yes stop_codon:yes gene_type:complete